MYTKRRTFGWRPPRDVSMVLTAASTSGSRLAPASGGPKSGIELVATAPTCCSKRVKFEVQEPEPKSFILRLRWWLRRRIS